MFKGNLHILQKGRPQYIRVSHKHPCRGGITILTLGWTPYVGYGGGGGGEAPND